MSDVRSVHAPDDRATMTDVRRGEPAGLVRRGTATFVDIVLGIVVATVLPALPGLVRPLDRVGGEALVRASLLLGVLALAYAFLGYALLPNTVGRWLTRVRVRDLATGRPPRIAQALLRALPMVIWPVEAILIAFTPTRRRLGDRLAGTVVERYDPEASRRARLGWGLGGVVGAYVIAGVIGTAIAGRTDAARAATAYAERELGGRRGWVRHVIVSGDAGYVVLDTEDVGPVAIEMRRDGGAWTPTAIHDRARLGPERGVRIDGYRINVGPV